MIKNEYKVFDEYAILYCNSRNGKILEVIIDAELISTIEDIGYKVYCHWVKHSGLYYATISVYCGFDEKGKRKTKSIMLHQVVLGYSGKDVIDHINRNTLDNRKQNLRIIKESDNLKNRKSKNSNNKSGHRNVCLYKGWYLVQMQVDGVNKLLFKSKNYEEACIMADKYREEYYGKFSGSGN